MDQESIYRAIRRNQLSFFATNPSLTAALYGVKPGWVRNLTVKWGLANPSAFMYYRLLVLPFRIKK
jgi:hypothetical protein